MPSSDAQRRPTEPIVGCDHLGLESDRERQIHRVEYGQADRDGRGMRVDHQTADRDGFRGDFGDVDGLSLTFFRSPRGRRAGRGDQDAAVQAKPSRAEPSLVTGNREWLVE